MTESPKRKTSRKILLADDHAVVREGLATVIEKYTPHTVVANVSDGLEAIEQARYHRPDLMIIDIGMPGLNGLEVLSQIRETLPGIKVLVLSIYRDRQYVVSAIRRGAAGYLLKKDAVRELVTAVERIVGGKRYISKELYEVVADEIMSPGRTVKSELEELSARERQVLSLIAEGASRREIAAQLHISPETVKTHRKNIMNKLKLYKRTALVKFALQHQLGPPPE